MESAILSRGSLRIPTVFPHLVICNRQLKFPSKLLSGIPCYPSFNTTKYPTSSYILGSPINSRLPKIGNVFGNGFSSKCTIIVQKRETVKEDSKLGNFGVLVKRVLVLCLMGLNVILCRRVFAAEGLVAGGVYGVLGRTVAYLKSIWPNLLKVLFVFKEQGLVLFTLLGLSAFFSMAETSITTLWPWKVRELAEKEPEGGVFRMLRNDVTRFLTTILIGTTVVNIGATALVTEAATTIFGEAGVSAATGVMTVCVKYSFYEFVAGELFQVAILLLTEITPKSIAVHHATEVARFVVRPVAWLSLILYPVGRVVTFLSMGMLKMLANNYLQDMIENVLEIKDTYVKEVMTPLVDVVAIDASATLIDFHSFWVTHQYSRVPVFEQRVDNIVGIAYAMDLLDYVQKGEVLESSTVGAIAHKPAYFVPDSMSVWNLLREFRIRKVHMAVVLNEYGGTVGIVTLEDVVEEIVGEIFDENDSKEEIQKKTGYVVMRAEGVYDVDANTSIDQLSEDLDITLPEFSSPSYAISAILWCLNLFMDARWHRYPFGATGHQYETVSGFICEAFGYIPRTGESIKVVLEKANREENNNYDEAEPGHQDQKDKHQTFRLEILAGNCRKVSALRFERVNHDSTTETKQVTRLVPRIWKRKSREDEDSSRSDDEKIVPGETGQ
ncbi:unnamed protein product [Ilex paraguariensis]|uniref:CBS domain-containing protein n=1 Tax=Ilex paraguariensis TaxID=185542 RepID=A0ABC8UHF4_9AQUA